MMREQGEPEHAQDADVDSLVGHAERMAALKAELAQERAARERAEADLKQIDKERTDWKRWCQDAERRYNELAAAVREHKRVHDPNHAQPRSAAEQEYLSRHMSYRLYAVLDKLGGEDG